MLSSQHKLLFIHIPKTGGSSMEWILRDLWDDSLVVVNNWTVTSDDPKLKHRDVAWYRHRRGPAWLAGHYKFAFVRNPFDRMVSWWAFHRRQKPWKTARSFKRYLRKTRPGHPERRTQSSYLLTPSGEMGVDFVGRYENLNSDFDKVCEKAGLPPRELTRMNQGRRGPYRDHYISESRALVEQWFAEDLERFGYEF